MSIEAEIVNQQLANHEDVFYSDTPHPKAGLSLCCDASRYDNGECMDCGMDAVRQIDYFAGRMRGRLDAWKDEDAAVRKTNAEGSGTPLASDKGEAQETVRRRKFNVLRNVRTDGKTLVRP